MIDDPELKHLLFRYSAGQHLQGKELEALERAGLLEWIGGKFRLTPLAEEAIRHETLG
jgi:hypothetical protein